MNLNKSVADSYASLQPVWAAEKVVRRSLFCFLLYVTNAKISFEKYLFQEKAMMAL